ncbi:RidA family protein [Undibacterium sp. Ji49W]|uniref:RidA family protein n=1 Tax=Undibacterium sp. Ji49W TaxID=3413040 RepID=UPI003BF2E395
MERRSFCISAAAFVAAIQSPASYGASNMNRRAINPSKTGWAHGHEVSNPSRILFISGQVPEASDGTVPKDFKAQCRLAWANVEKQLVAADMTLNNIAKMTIFLSDRRYIQEAYEVRAEVLGKNTVPPAMTILIAGIYDEAWLLEIEVIAVA